MKTAILPFLALRLVSHSILAEEPAAPPGLRLAEVPGGLAEMLTAALRSNPEILQAEARVRQAQANLNQTRLKVTEEVVAAFHERQKQEAALRGAEQAFENARKRVQNGTASQAEVIAAEQAYSAARAKLMQDEAHARYLLGLGGLVGDPAAAAASAPATTPGTHPRRERPPIPERYRQALAEKASSAAELKDAEALAAFLRAQLQAQVFNTLGNSSWQHDLRLQDATLRQLLTAAHDLCGLCLVFRDYGILITTCQRAASMNAPAFPEDFPLKD